MLRSLLSSMIPATSKTMVLGPDSANAALREPAPLSARVVTWITFPPRPPVVYIPPPSAPGNANTDMWESSTAGTLNSAYASVISGLSPGSCPGLSPGSVPGSDEPPSTVAAESGSDTGDSISPTLALTVNT